MSENGIAVTLVLSLLLNVVLAVLLDLASSPHTDPGRALQIGIARASDQKRCFLCEGKMEEYDFWCGIETQMVERLRARRGEGGVRVP